MPDVFPRRDLGPSDYWARVVEGRITAAGKAWNVSDSSLAGLSRASDAQSAELARQIAALEDAFLAVPGSATNVVNTSNFALSEGWNTVLSFGINSPVAGKSVLDVVGMGRVSTWDEGPAPYIRFQWPFSPTLIASEYGWRDTGFHSGTDFAGGAASSGQPIYAPADGVVSGKGTDGSRGNYINLSHPTGPPTTTRYFHLIAPSPLGIGDPVTRGVTVLGYVGNTGASYGAHLHWETYIDGAPLNEESYPAMNPRDFMDIFEGPPSGGGEHARISSRLRIAGSPSLEFDPLLSSEPAPVGRIINSFVFPQHGLRYLGASATVQLEVYASADVPASTRNTASLSAFGIFS